MWKSSKPKNETTHLTFVYFFHKFISVFFIIYTYINGNYNTICTIQYIFIL
jgi:hypothetical protein